MAHCYCFWSFTHAVHKYLSTYVGQSGSCLFILFAEHWCVVYTWLHVRVYLWVPLESWLLLFSRCTLWACVYSRHVHHGRLYPILQAAGLSSSQMRPGEKKHSGNIRVSDLPAFHHSFLLQSWTGKLSFFMVLACSLIFTASISAHCYTALQEQQECTTLPAAKPNG